jgi:8-oxo-dGTP pyrophosphatase MutT (NUDIX family)
VGGPTIREPAVAAVAATVVLVRDGPHGLETLMVVRHHEIDFARGAAVFPGGKLSVSDSDPRIAGRVRGGHLPGEQQFALRVAAVRETFEESGLLLARLGGAMIDGTQRAALHQRWQARVSSGGNAFVDMVCEEDLELALEQLVPYAHWVTPEVSPKRFDTHFFIAAAPPGQVAQHDGSEAVDSFWVRRPMRWTTVRSAAAPSSSRPCATWPCWRRRATWPAPCKPRVHGRCGASSRRWASAQTAS